MFGFAEPGSTQLSRVGGNELPAGHKAEQSMAGSPAVSCSQEGVPKMSERQTWQVIGSWMKREKDWGLKIISFQK